IVGNKVGLSSTWVLVAILIGGEAFGFIGILLAVPSAAVIKIFVLRALQAYRSSWLFAAPEAQALSASAGRQHQNAT
ncbi:MAG: AI-2E family transporter, partial [Sandaracinaceae bacterium]|nr:AI-2E family transporter [Sandaracinaceae bacterium]